MALEFDYVVVGGGCIGAAIAFHLAKQVKEAGGTPSIALLEREKFLGQCSTGKCAGGVRAQFSTEVNTRLSLLSIAEFEKFESVTGHPLQLFQWGYLFLLGSDEQVAAFRRYRERWLSLGMKVEWLEPAEIGKRFPYVNLDGIQGATFHARDGFADPNDIVQGYATAARGLGVTELTECEVTGVELVDGGTRVAALQTTRGRVGVRKSAALAAGAWSKPLGKMMGSSVPIEPYRRQILVTKAFDGIKPPFPMTVDMTSGLYFHPESGGVLMGLADNDEKPSYNEALNESFSDVMLAAAMHRAPALEEAAVKTGWAGLYETTEDHHPIFDWAHPVKNAWVCAGFSGHGLMHAPAAGMVSADMLLHGRTQRLDISPLSLLRFGNPNALLHEVNVI